MRPLIAVVGSAEPTRTYDPPLRHPELVAPACADLGRELAAAGCDLLVYSSVAGFIEADVVRGYVASGAARPGSIHVHSPVDSRGGQFAAAKEHRDLFDPRPDSSGDWEVSYYRSLVEADGVLLVGGGRSTFVTGLVALAFAIPTLPVATFGGHAAKVWPALDRVRNGTVTPELGVMAAPDWRADSAKTLVTGLLAQRDRRAQKAERARRAEHREDRRAAVSLTIAAGLLLLGLATIPAVYAWTPGTAGNLTALIAAPVLVAPCGAIIRNTLDEGRRWWRTAVLGMVAGAVAGLLFVAAQLSTTPDVLDGPAARRLLLFVLPVGFIAGLTFDAVYSKLRTQDVADTTALTRR